MDELVMGANLMLSAGEVATYTPPDGAAVATRCWVQHGVVSRDGDGRKLERLRIAYLPAMDVPDPLRGGLIAIGAARWVVDSLYEDDGAIVAAVVRPQ